jgi:hypothetical protein
MTIGSEFSDLFRDKLDRVRVDSVGNQLDAQTGTPALRLWLGPEAGHYVGAAAQTIGETSDVVAATVAQGDNVSTWYFTPFFCTSLSASIGVRVVRFIVYYKVATADLDAATFSMNTMTLAAPPTGAAVALTGTPLVAIGSHAVTMTVTSPAFLDGSSAVQNFVLAFDKAATSDLTFYGVNVALART